MKTRDYTPHRVAGPRRSRGVASVEFAIAAPLLLLTLLATAEIGRALVHSIGMGGFYYSAAAFETG